MGAHTYICICVICMCMFALRFDRVSPSNQPTNTPHKNNTVDTYSQFCDENEPLLKRLPPPKVAIEYYVRGDLFLFDEFQTSRPAYSRCDFVGCVDDFFLWSLCRFARTHIDIHTFIHTFTSHTSKKQPPRDPLPLRRLCRHPRRRVR